MRRHRIASFLLLAFGISWALVGVGWILGARHAGHPFYGVVAAVCMFGPAIAAIIQQRLIDRDSWEGLGSRFRDTRWKMLAWTALLGMLLVPTVLLVIHLLGNMGGWDAIGRVSMTSERLVRSIQDIAAAQGVPVPEGQLKLLTSVPAAMVLVILQLVALLGALTFNVPFMLGEELGWRGYLWQRTAHWSGSRRVLFTGVAWGLWHAPLILMGHNYPSAPWSGVGMMVVLCVLFALFFDWSRTRSGSVWSSVLLHGLINGSAGGFVLFAGGGHPLVATPVGVAGFIAFALLGGALLLLDRDYRSCLLATRSPVTS
ncbi:MAG: CPBP family intramembrane metalloprotease [Flavobacteriales bacterium]|nr:CPBP family intramembrane metalloprotease [Flavobacteriales bacterium]